MTFEEFLKLPEDERAEGYKKLSSHDRFRVRISMDNTSYDTFIPCNTCKHRLGITCACEAYPDGLTGDIIRGKIDNPYGECKNSIYYMEAEVIT